MEKSFRNFQQKASLSVNTQGRTRIPPLLALELVSLLLEINVVYGKQQRYNASLCLPSCLRTPPSSPKRIFVHYQHSLCFTTLFSVLVHITVTRSIGQQ